MVVQLDVFHRSHTYSLAAKASGLPSVLVSNFSFDSVYSYFSTPLSNISVTPTDPPSLLGIIPDESIPYEEMSPFVDQVQSGYRCADLLVRLPGYIPIPSFYANPPLPSFKWVDEETRKFKPEIAALLDSPHDVLALLPSLDLLSETRQCFPELLRNGLRKVIQAPLLVRSPKTKSSVYTPEGRSAFLSTIGVPIHLQDPGKTKILVVSFGGQTFKWPRKNATTNKSQNSSVRIQVKDGLTLSTQCDSSCCRIMKDDTTYAPLSPRLATPGHIWTPGAPPTFKAPVSPSPPQSICPPIHESPTASSSPNSEGAKRSSEFNCIPQLLPDSSWIAIIGAISEGQRETISEAGDLPEGFYVAPSDVYIPDLSAMGDVFLGKLVSQSSRKLKTNIHIPSRAMELYQNV